jgi:hypothetical protein
MMTIFISETSRNGMAIPVPGTIRLSALAAMAAATNEIRVEALLAGGTIHTNDNRGTTIMAHPSVESLGGKPIWICVGITAAARRSMPFATTTECRQEPQGRTE